jgi:hypothetical protein
MKSKKNLINLLLPFQAFQVKNFNNRADTSILTLKLYLNRPNFFFYTALKYKPIFKEFI